MPTCDHDIWDFYCNSWSRRVTGCFIISWHLPHSRTTTSRDSALLLQTTRGPLERLFCGIFIFSFDASPSLHLQHNPNHNWTMGLGNRLFASSSFHLVNIHTHTSLIKLLKSLLLSCQKDQFEAKNTGRFARDPFFRKLTDKWQVATGKC